MKFFFCHKELPLELKSELGGWRKRHRDIARECMSEKGSGSKRLSGRGQFSCCGMECGAVMHTIFDINSS